MHEKLYRSKSNKMIAGVCGGIGEYLRIDPTIVRILCVAACFTGAGLLAYIIGIIIIPERPADQPYSEFAKSSGEDFETDFSHTGDFEGKTGSKRTSKPGYERSGLVIGAGLVILGALLLARQFLHWLDVSLFWPVVIILIGVVVLTRGRKSL